MTTIGLDCDIVLDGTGYFIEPDSYAMLRPRVRRASLNRTLGGAAGAGERQVDSGPGKREWSFIVTCYQAMRTFAGQPVSSTGQQYRDALHTSYNKVNTALSFTDPAGTVWSVRFDNLSETISNVRAAGDGQMQYLCHVALTEA